MALTQRKHFFPSLNKTSVTKRPSKIRRINSNHNAATKPTPPSAPSQLGQIGNSLGSPVTAEDLQQQGQSLLFRLPPELRQMVYEELLGDDTPHANLVESHRVDGKFCPAVEGPQHDGKIYRPPGAESCCSCGQVHDLLFSWRKDGLRSAKNADETLDRSKLNLALASRALYKEYSDFVFTRSSFIMPGLDKMAALTRRMPTRQLTKIRNLHLTCYCMPSSYIPSACKNLEALRKMTGLRNLTMSMDFIYASLDREAAIEFAFMDLVKDSFGHVKSLEVIFPCRTYQNKKGQWKDWGLAPYEALSSSDMMCCE